MRVKKQRKEISNKDYNEAFNNQDNKNIIGTVLSKYRGRLDEDTLKMCGLNALWRCLQFHDIKYTTKFTSSLWRFTNWECKKELQTLARSKYRPTDLFDVPEDDEGSLEIFNDIKSILNEELSKIVKLRFVDGFTLQEIGRHFGYSKEAARQKLRLALSQIETMVYNIEQG